MAEFLIMQFCRLIEFDIQGQWSKFKIANDKHELNISGDQRGLYIGFDQANKAYISVSICSVVLFSLTLFSRSFQKLLL